MLQRAGELLHGGSRLLQVAGGLLGAHGQVLVAGGDLGAGDGDAVRALAHLLHHARQRFAHGLQRAQQVAEFISTLRLSLHACAQVACGNAFGQFAGLGQGTADAGNQEMGADDDAQQQQAHSRSGKTHGEPARGCRLFLAAAHHLLLHLHEVAQRLQIGIHGRVVGLLDQGQRLLLPAVGLELACLGTQFDHGLAGCRNPVHLRLVCVGQGHGFQ